MSAHRGAVSAAAAVRQLLRALPAAGYGLWALLGGGLALATLPHGRGDMLVPLTLGLMLIVAGMLGAGNAQVATLGLRRGSRPSRDGLMAMATILPMLAVAGLVRGDNTFWATRLAGAVLVACALATLALARRAEQPESVPARAAHVLVALFAGGLWLWLCLSLQEDVVLVPLSVWHLGLLAIGFGAAVLDNGQWRRRGGDSAIRVRDRLGALALAFALPLALLVAAGGWPQAQTPLAVIAAVACTCGTAALHTMQAAYAPLLASRS